MHVLNRRGSSTAELHRAVLVAHGPLRMGRERIAPVEVGTHAGDDAHIALLGGGHALAEKVAAMQVFSVAMKLHLRGVKRQDAGDADKDNVGVGGVPVVGPLFNVHHGGVVLGHVALSDAANSSVARAGARRQMDRGAEAAG